MFKLSLIIATLVLVNQINTFINVGSKARKMFNSQCHFWEHGWKLRQYSSPPKRKYINEIFIDCRCGCYSNQSSITIEELAEMIANLTSLLAVNKKSLSSYTRKLNNCANDSRTSSKCFGALGIIVIIVSVSLVAFEDVVKLVQYLKQIMLKCV